MADFGTTTLEQIAAARIRAGVRQSFGAPEVGVAQNSLAEIETPAIGGFASGALSVRRTASPGLMLIRASTRHTDHGGRNGGRYRPWQLCRQAHALG
jgi:hypothetical protein